ncbi:PQQ-binding-like beta-propeller repeat protein [Flavihumibacter rivuli]|uniref:outer membrane protein assembly factor BamB family protein n=1 Tax=Flavihumibacter rivuli TaxID=2838156 RepID=UPI001BDE61A7|nr:PQQ-binding-like beta-propeller repeat protein [Flavihumibacter rivuli]ULQ55208.1 PQQ-binding-like beta-propeller repeat protein [Flavihumibacter rivuli]
MRYTLLALLAAYCLSCTTQPDPNWSVYGGSKANTRYSPLTQIDTTNVTKLQPAWTYHTGDADSTTQIQVNPLIIDGILYGVSPKLKLFALEAASGKEIWRFDPATDTLIEAKGAWYFSMNVCRGLAIYQGGTNDNRLFYGAGSRLFCIDAKTGKPIRDFGDGGYIDLHNDLGPRAKDLYVAATSPGIVYKDMIIVGTRVAEEPASAPGHIRAYDVHTGKLRWIFHTISQPGEYGFESWDDPKAWEHIGGANAWSGFSLDEERGIVFAGTGSAAYDFYGGKRLGNNLFANCVLALDANTGKRRWHYQVVHHDVWDRDLPTPPALVTVKKDGKAIDAVAQPTKHGFIFLLDRETGQPIYPINEVAVPKESLLKGERLSPTQPVPTFPEPFVRQQLTEKDLNTLVPDSSYQEIRKQLSGYLSGNMFHPPSPQGTVIFPGFDGGAEWGGPAYDPQSGWLYVNANEMPWVLTMIEKSWEDVIGVESIGQAGKRLYASNCLSCHGPKMEGGGNYPSLLAARLKYDTNTLVQLIHTGRRMMPAFSQLKQEEKQAIAAYVLDLKKKQQEAYKGPRQALDPYYDVPYRATGYIKFLTKEGYPAVAPPWGTLNAIDLNTGKIAWKQPLGEYPELKAKGIPATGTENYGGPVVTAGGLVFIAAAKDSKIRAFHKQSGKLLWEADLPAPGFATPSIYEAGGKQYLVIACGGGKLKTPSGDSYVAFALGE